MRRALFYISLIVLFITSCEKKQKETNTPPEIHIENIDQPSKDSILTPQRVLAGKPEIIIAGEPTVTSTRNNLYSITDSLKREINNPLVITPGKNKLSHPTKTKVKENPVLAAPPKIREAKEIHVKDQNPYSFSYYSRLQGLIHNNVKAITNDNDGNIWIGAYSGGVSKFDGKRFTNYTSNEGLNNDLVWDILFDKSGNLWISTLNKGVSKFDGKYFTHFSTEEGLADNRIWSIFEDTNGNIWFGTDDGITKYDGESFINYTDKQGLINTSIATIFQDKNGNIWFGCYKGNGAMRFDGKNFISYGEKEGFINNSITAITEDNKGNIWFGKFDGGIAKYDGKTFTHYNEPTCLSHRINEIIQDNKGYFWIGTFGGGLCKFDGKNIMRFTENEGMPNNKVYDILFENGSVWIATSGGGLSKFGGDMFTHLTTNEGLSSNEILSILKDTNDNIWLATYGNGLSRYDGENFYHYSEDNGLTDGNVYDIIEDRNGNIWAATFEGGLSRFDGKSFTNYNTDNGLNSNQTLAILENQKGNIWIATYSNGAIKFDGNYFTYYTTNEGLTNNPIMCLLEDKDGNIWFGTYGDGAIKFDGKDFTAYNEENGLCGNIVTSFLEDSSGNIWFGSMDKGISKYDGNHFTNFTIEDGLSDNSISSIMQAKNGDIWFGTKNGISRLTKQNLLHYCNDPNRYKVSLADKKEKRPIIFERYVYEDGFLGNSCYRGAIGEDKNGNIWVGTVSKLTQIHPEGIRFDTIPPTIQLTGIKLFNESIPWTVLENKKDTILMLNNGVSVSDFNLSGTTHWYGLPKELSLKYNNNFLAFNFVGITQRQSSYIKYQYKLDGLDKNWSQLSGNDQASYGNLPPGKYTFMVKAMSGNGYWSNDFQYPFTIRPPWWKTLWFRIIATISIIIGLLSFYFWRISVLHRQKKYLEKIVKEKTAIVVQQKEDLLKQKNELEIANVTKDKFFSIIAHDLRSPFNSFLGLTYFMANELKSLKKGDIKEIAEGMHKSASNLSNLLENLLQWARIQQGLISFDLAQLTLDVVVNEAIKFVKESANNKSINIITDIPHNLSVYADHNVINTVIRNLLSNAIKFTKKEGRITISAKEMNQDFIKISIEDTGIGMSPSLIEKLFRLDEKSNRQGTEGETSSGLGLILCKDFIEKSGGQLWVESEENIGSTFSFSLPRNQQID